MHYFDSATIEGSVYLHQIGNKQNGEPLILSKAPLKLNEDISLSLKRYFLSHFKPSEYYSFFHEASLSLNEVYNYVSSIFEDVSTFEEQSKYLAQTLYRNSIHPNIKSGEFYVVRFRNCILDGQFVDAVGLFKSENKDAFLKVFRSNDGFVISQELGVNINKLDKGCLIFNSNKHEGYIVSVVDNSNRGEAKYWVDSFLQVKRRNDGRTQTQKMVKMCRDFIMQLPDDVNKLEKVEMMNRIVNGLKTDNVDVAKIARNAFGNKLADNQFVSFKTQFEEQHDIKFDDIFVGKPDSIKKQVVESITTIKLDSNFDISIHGGEHLIERGYNTKIGKHYYILYFDEEK